MKGKCVTATMVKRSSCLLFGGVWLALWSANSLAQPYEAYFLYNGAYPDHEETPYSGECENNIQGITHDDNNWFISMTEELWKIPVGYDLRHVNDSSQFPGVIHQRLSDYPLLVQSGFFHIGDLSYFSVNGQGYVIAPIEAHSPQPHAIVLFRADNLQYVCHTVLPAYGDLGWVAVDPRGVVYVSGDFDTKLKRYYAEWNQLPQALSLAEMPSVDLVREDGSPFDGGHTQGGVFSPSGEIFYFLSGIFNGHDPNDGINVFVVDNLSLTWRRVKQSYEGDDYQPFWYHFDTGSPDYEEPEGLTFWDLDDGRAPGISGQLHVVMLDNDGNCPWWPDDDDVAIYHYRNTIHVDGQFVAPPYNPDDPIPRWTGEPAKPFTTVTDANSLAWDGCRMKILGGTYREAVTFARRMEVMATGGLVQIGPVP